MKISILDKLPDEEDEIIIKCDSLDDDLRLLIERIKNRRQKINFLKDSKIIFAELSEILYFESVDDKVFAYTREEVIRLEGSLNSFIGEVQGDLFFRCSKSMIINVNKVSALKSLSSNRIDATMENGEHIMISRRYASDFRRLLRGYK